MWPRRFFFFVKALLTAELNHPRPASYRRAPGPQLTAGRHTGRAGLSFLDLVSTDFVPPPVPRGMAASTIQARTRSIGRPRRRSRSSGRSPGLAWRRVIAS